MTRTKEERKAPAWAEYVRIRDAAEAEYVRIRDSARAAYVSIRRQAWVELQRELRAIEEEP